MALTEDDFQAAANEITQRATADKTRAVVDFAAVRQPDAHATNLKVSREVGIPPDVVPEFMGDINKRKLGEDFIGLVQTAPKTHQFVTSDPNHAALMQDALPQSVRLEAATKQPDWREFEAKQRAEREARGQAIGEIGRGVLTGAATLVPQTAAGATGMARMATEVFVSPFSKTLASITGGKDYAAELVQRLAGEQNFQEAVRADMAQKAGTLMRTGGISEGVVSGLSSAAQLGLALVAPELALPFMAGTTTGQAYGAARGKGVAPIEAIPFAAAQGTIEYFTEKFALGKFLEAATKGRPLARAALGVAVKDIGGEQVATFFQDLNEVAVLTPEKPMSQFWEERPNAALQTLIGTLVGGGGAITLGATVDTLNKLAGRKVEEPAQLDQQRAAFSALQAEVNQSRLQELFTVANEHPLRARESETFKAWVASVTEDSDLAEVYVDATKLSEVLTQQGTTLQELQAAMPEVATQLGEALATQGEVRIPVADLVTHITNPAVQEALLPHLKTSPDGMTYDQSQVFYQEQVSELEAQAQKLAEGTPAAEEVVLTREEFEAQVAPEQPALAPEAQQRIGELQAKVDAGEALPEAESIELGLLQATQQAVVQQPTAPKQTYEQYLSERKDKAAVRAAEVKNIRSEIVREMKGMKVFPEHVASAYAAPLVSFYLTNSARLGVMPSELRRMLPVRFAAEALMEGKRPRYATAEDFTKANIGNILSKQDWAIMTAENPGAGVALSAEENAARNEALKADLDAAGLKYIPVNGVYERPDEKSFIVLGISAEQAMELGRKHGQDSVLTREGLVFADGTVAESTGITVREVPAEVSAEELAGDGRDFTAFFEAAARGMRKPDTGKKYSPGIDLSSIQPFVEEYAKHRANFDDHIAHTIPGFREVQQAVAAAIAKTYDKGGDVLDIGASEGALIKTISAMTEGRVRTLGIDPNAAMAEVFDKQSKVEGATYSMAAFGAKSQEGEVAWEENGSPVSFFKPTKKYDVIHEAMVFQFIANKRDAQVRRVKELLKPEGIAIFEEKFLDRSDPQWQKNEAQKDSYKAQYFSSSAMAQKAKEVLTGKEETDESKAEQAAVGMNDFMGPNEAFEEVLKTHFNSVVQFWDSGNFKGYVVSDSVEATKAFTDNLVDLNTQYSERETPREVQSRAEQYYTTLPDGTAFTIDLKMDADFNFVREPRMAEPRDPASVLLQAVDQTQTEAFKKWFGDSKVVDAEGKPLVVYHGTRADFTSFERGSWFAEDPKHAGSYATDSNDQYSAGSRIVPVFLQLKNPLDLRSVSLDDWFGAGEATRATGVPSLPEGLGWEIVSSALFIRAAKRMGYDGVIALEAHPHTGKDSLTFKAFYPTQIKSAIGNVGTFDPKNPNILYQGGKLGEVSITGHHFSPVRRATLDGRYYGTGAKGAEARRLAASKDRRISQRLHFYVDEGNGVFPEAGVGREDHVVKLNNLYDAARNPLRIPADDFNAFESAVLDAGFDGYYIEQGFTRQGVAVLLGEGSHNVDGGTPNATQYAQAMEEVALGEVPEKWSAQDLADVRKLWAIYASSEEAAKFGAFTEKASSSTAEGFAKNLEDTLSAVFGSAVMTPDVKDISQFREGMHAQTPPGSFTFRMSKRNNTAEMYVNPKTKQIQLNISDWQEGFEGTGIYKAVLDFARNNGYVFIGDTQGISVAGIKRRLENLLSHAIQSGDTIYMALHPKQLSFIEQETGEKLNWVEGDHKNNVEQMLKASYNLTILDIPELQNVYFDFIRREYIDASTKEVVADLAGYVTKARRNVDVLRREGAAGITTATRTVFTNTILRAHGADSRRLAFNRLAQFVLESLPGAQGLLYQSVEAKPTFYSALTRALETHTQKKGSPDQWIGIIKNLTQKGIKSDELEFTGILDWLEGQKTHPDSWQLLQDGVVVAQKPATDAPYEPTEGRTTRLYSPSKELSREAVIDYLRDNLVVINPLTKSGDVLDSIDISSSQWETEEPDADWLFEKARGRMSDASEVDEARQKIADDKGIEPEEVTEEQLEDWFYEREERWYWDDRDSPRYRSLTATFGDEEIQFDEYYSYGDRYLRTSSGKEIDLIRGHGVEDAIRQYIYEKYEMSSDGEAAKWSDYQLPGGADYTERLLINESHKGQAFEYTTHFDEENIAAFTRYNTRFVALENIEATHPELVARLRSEGKTQAKVYFLEELQSDWAQQGRERGNIQVRYTREELSVDEEQTREAEERRKKLAIIKRNVSMPNEEPSYLYDVYYRAVEGQAIVEEDHLFGRGYQSLEEAEYAVSTAVKTNVWHIKAPDNVFQIPKRNYPTLEAAMQYAIESKTRTEQGKLTAFEASKRAAELEKQYEEVVHELAVLRTSLLAKATRGVRGGVTNGGKIGELTFKEVPPPEGKELTYFAEEDKHFFDGVNAKGVVVFNTKQAVTIEDQLLVLARESVEDAPEMEALQAKKNAIRAEQAALPREQVPYAPFVKSTDAWVALAMKDAIHNAAENDYDIVAWTTGSQQTQRWSHGLRQKVDTIRWEKTPEGIHIIALQRGQERANTRYQENALTSAIGKTMAERIIADPNQSGEISGEEIVVADLGMSYTYGNAEGLNPDGKVAIYPKVANNVLKALGGGKVAGVTLSKPVEMNDYPEYYDRQATAQPGFEITPKMKEMALQGQPLFQPKNLASFDPSTLTVSMMKGANLSSVLHESGHFYLEALSAMSAHPNAPQQMKDDFDKTLKWFGVPDRATWDSMTLDQKRPYHEQWAQSQERWYLEGKAPSLEMQPVFERFRKWMLSVYRSVEQFLRANPLAGKLNDEMRGVFSRLVAAEDTILEAERVRSYAALFPAAEAGGVTDAQFEAYRALGDEATQAAITDMQGRTLRDLKWLSNAKNKALKKLQKEANAKRKAIREEVAAEVAAEQINQARRFLTTGEALDPTTGEFVKAEVGFKLNSDDLAAMYPKTALSLPDLSKLRGMTNREGLHPDMVAPMFGFPSGDALVRELIAAEPMKDKIDGLTDQRMLERHGELVDADSLERAAEAAIHNEVRARFLATGLQILTKSPVPAKDMLKAAKQAAENTIARKKVRELRPKQYASAEARANKQALAEAARDPAKASEAQRAALLNNQLSKAATEAQEEVEKFLRFAAKFESEGTRKNLDIEYLEQIDDLLAPFDLRKGETLKAIDKRRTLAEWVERQEDMGFEPIIDAAMLEEAKRKHYKDMTLEELRDLVDSIKQIEHLGRLKKKLLTAKDAREFAERIEEAVASIEANANRTVPERATPTDVVGMTGKWARQMAASHRKFASIVREMDGSKDNGVMWNLLVRSMNEAGDTETEMKAQAAEKLAILFRGIREKTGGIKSHIKAKRTQVPGTKLSMTYEERIMFAMNWGNEGNRQRLLDGGLTGQRSIAEADAVAVLETLDKEDWDFVQGVLDYVGSYRDQIAEQERRLTGKEPKWIDPAPIHTKFGIYRGGYFPAKYDAELSSRSESLEAATNLRLGMKGAFNSAATRNGYTKERSEAVKGRPLLLSFNAIAQHANEVTHRLAWQDWLVDANRILKALDGTVRDSYGAEILREMRDTVKDIAAGDAPASNPVETAINRIRVGSTVVGMAWRISTALLQPTGLAQSWVRVGGPWIARGLKQYGKNPMAAAELVNSKSKLMRDRGRTMQREINEVLNTVRVGDTMAASHTSYFWLIQKMQRTVDIPTWLGAYEKAAQSLKLESAGDAKTRQAIEENCIALADQAVIDAQSGGQLKDLAKVQRGSPIFKLFTNFYSYFSSTYNLNVEAYRRTSFKSPSEVGMFAVDMVILNTVPVVMSVALKELLKGGCEDDDIECLLGRIGHEQLNFLMGQMILLREAGAALDVATGGGGFGYSGPAGLRFFGDLYKLGQQAGQGEADLAFFKAANQVAGAVLHYPAGQVNSTIEGIVEVEKGNVEGVAVLPALVAGKPRKED